MEGQKLLETILKPTGIVINGTKNYDIQVYDKRLYDRVIAGQSLALGESYMDGWWDCKKIDLMICKLLEANIKQSLSHSPSLIASGLSIKTKEFISNRQSLLKAKHNASFHYNIGNDLYERMLDKRMIYTCAYWKSAKSLDQAQVDKLKLICDKLHLKKGMTVLDIGCGWGGFAKYAAEQYGVKVTGISLAEEQVKYAIKNTAGLPVKILLKDYRQVKGLYDRVVSIGMFEAVGHKNYATFFNKCTELLKDDGIMLHHTIGSNISVKHNNPFLEKYIFPGGSLPSLGDISEAIKDILVIEDLHNIGPDYVKTLNVWQSNFNKRYQEISQDYDERFMRMWNFYLMSCSGAFMARHMLLWQMVFRKKLPAETYIGVR